MGANWTLYAARALSGAWAAWWMFFGIASGVGEKPFTWMNLVMHLIPVALTVVPTVIAWRRPVLGGILLLLLGISLIGLVVFGVFAPFPFTVVVLIIPPIVAGLLFLIPGHREPSAG